MSYISIGSKPSKGNTPNAVFFGLKEDGTTGLYRWALQISAQNYLFQELLKAIGFEQDRSLDSDTNVDTENWPIFVMQEGPIGSFNPQEYGLKIVPDPPREPKLEVISPTQKNDWSIIATSKPKFAGTSFSEKITNQPNAESGFWFSRDNRTLEPGFNLVLRLDEKLKIDESRTVVLSEAKLNEKPIKIYTESEMIHISLPEGAILSFRNSALTLEWNLNHTFPLQYFFIAEKIVKFKLAPSSAKLKLSLGSTGRKELKVYLPPQNPAPTAPVSLLMWVESCLMMKNGGDNLPLLVPTVFEDNLRKEEGVLPPLKFSLKVNSLINNIEPLTLVSLANESDNYSDVSGLPSSFEGLPIKIEVGEIDVDHNPGILLSGLKTSLAELRADPDKVFRFMLTQLKENFQVYLKQMKITIPVKLKIDLPRETSVALAAAIELDLNTFRLRNNRLYFYIANDESIGEKTPKWFDLTIFAFGFTKRKVEKLATEDSRDGYIDLEEREIVIAPNPKPQGGVVRVVFPGGNLSSPPTSDDPIDRFYFQLKELKENKKSEPYYFRLGSKGLSFHAEVQKSRVLVEKAEKTGEVFKEVAMQPVEERNKIRSELRVVNTQLLGATAFATMPLPGFKNLVGLVEVGLRQEERGKPPKVIAGLQLEKSDHQPLGEFDAKYLRMQLDDLRLALTWENGGKWNFQAEADGQISLNAKQLSQIGGLDQLLDQSAIQVDQLNLKELNKSSPALGLKLRKPVEFSILDGYFTCWLYDLQLSWTQEEKDFIVKLKCSRAGFRFRSQGALEVAVEAGGINVEVGNGQARVAFPSKLGIEVHVSSAVQFRGEVAWVDTPKERYFAAAGTVTIEGLPEISALLKLGTGKKANGQVVPNVVVYASADIDIQLFTGVVAKNIGAGLGINNQLKAIGTDPDADRILANIDTLRPDKIDSWSFIEEDGFYLSIVASTILASNAGGTSVLNAYVTWLILTLDTQLNIAAAGKFWLSSSVDFIRKNDNFNRPVLVGALSLVPRKKTLRAVLESRPNPAIQIDEGGQLSRIFNQARIRISFYLSPDVVEYYLEEVSYRANFLNAADVLFIGSYRIAIFEGVALLKAKLGIRGNLPKREVSAGCGGFSFEGSLAVLVEYGGIISRSGMMAYGLIDARITFRVSAWIEIGFEKTIGWGRWKKTIGWSKKFNLGSSKIELGLSGGVAFNTRGDFGFRGKISISVSICGYRLEISPSLQFNPGVIDNVRTAVAAYESRLNRLTGRSKAIGPASRARAVTFSASRGSAAAIVTPTSGSPATVAPSPPVSPVGSPPPVTPITLGTPVDDTSAGSSAVAPETTASEETATSQAIPTAGDQEEWLCYLRKAGTPDTYYVLLLPSLKTPWFVPQYEGQEINFKHHVKKIELTVGTETPQTIAEIKSPTELPEDELPAVYPYLIESATQIDPNKEIIRDLNEEIIREANATIKFVTDPRVESTSRAYWNYEDQFRLPAYALPYEFRYIKEIEAEGGGDNNLDEILRYEELRLKAAKSKLYRSPSASEVEQLQQTRASVVRLMLEDFNNISAATQKLTFGSFITTVTAQNLTEDLTQAVSARVYREGQEPEGRPIALKFPDQLKSNDFSDGSESVMAIVKRLPIRQKFVPIDGDPNQVGKVLVRLPIKFQFTGDNDKQLKQFLPSINYFRIYRQFPWEEKPNLIADFVRPHLTYVKDQEKDEQYILISPYLYTDEFNVITTFDGRRVPDIRGLNAGETEILYSLEAVPYGELKPEQLRKEIGLWASVRLYIPPPDLFPKSLAIVFPVKELYQDTLNPKFQLISDVGERFELAKQGDRLLTAAEFELWAEEFPLRQSGFYVGGEFEVKEKPRNPDDRLQQKSVPNDESNTDEDSRDRGPISQLEPEKLFQSTDGKFRVLIKDVSAGTFEITNAAQLRSGFGYRFFIRPTESARNALVAPTGLFLVQQLPDTWSETRQLRSVDHIERIDIERIDGNALEGKGLLLDRKSFTVIDFEKYDRNHLRCFWESTGLTDGGVEIVIRDLDEPTQVYKQVCEVMEEAVFRVSQRDFSNFSLWTLTPGEQQKRLEEQQKRLKVTPLLGETSIPDAKILSYFLPNMKDLTNGEDGLDQRKKDLDNTLPNWSRWTESFPVLKEWMEAVHVYRRSPYNLNDSKSQNLIRALFLTVKLLVTGITLENTPAISEPPDKSKFLEDLIQYLEKQEQELKDKLEATETLSLAESEFTTLDDNATKLKFQDITIAKKLAAIVQHRLAYAEAILGAASLESLKPTSEKLPYSIQWNELRKAWKVLDPEPANRMTSTSWFFKNFGETGDVSSILINRLQELSNRLQKTLNAETIGKITPTAKGLAQALSKLRERVKSVGYSLIQRPHHQLVIEDESKPGGKEAVKTKLENFLPDSTRLETAASEINPQEKTGSNSEIPKQLTSEKAKSVVAYFNLLERLGFAIDIAAVNQLYEIVNLKELCHQIEQAKIEEIQELKDYRLVIITGHEPDAEYLRPEEPVSDDPAQIYDESIGFSFVKLAVIPKEFHEDTREWYLNRSIDLGTDRDKEKEQLTRLREIAEYVWQPIKEFGQLYFIRVETRVTQWLTLPAIAARSHSQWTVPDLKGHRYQVAVRKVSRYEPIVRWAKNFTRPIELPSDEKSLKNYWQTISVLRILPAQRDQLEGPAALEVLSYPNPTKIQFTYRIPPEGARSLYNAISAVRTGYKGCDFSFAYEIIKRDELKNIVKSIQQELNSQLEAPLDKPKPIPGRDQESSIRLFRHERLVTLADLPYFYQYSLEVRSLFKVRQSLSVDAQNPKFAQRKPSQICIFQPTIRKTPEQTYELTIFLTRNRDNLSPAEIAASPPPLCLNASGNRFEKCNVDGLPDFSMGYQILYKVNAEASSSEQLYILLAEILMPWRTGYNPPEPPPPVHPPEEPPQLPLIRVLSGEIEVVEANQGKKYTTIAYNQRAEQTYDYAIQFSIEDKSGLFNDLSLYFLQASFDDAVSSAKQFNDVTGWGDSR